MLTKTTLPVHAALADRGVQLISRVNPVDPTHGAVTYRDAGLPLELRTRYEAHQDSKFHRYASVNLVGSFSDLPAAAAAVAAAEHALRMSPAPGVALDREVGERPVAAAVTLGDNVPLGIINTQWDAKSRSVVNTTTPVHLMRDGFVVRQVSLALRNIYMVLFGEGENLTEALAWANGTFGPSGFDWADKLVSKGLSSQSGFLPAPANNVPGAGTAYWDARVDPFVERLKEANKVYVPI